MTILTDPEKERLFRDVKSPEWVRGLAKIRENRPHTRHDGNGEGFAFDAGKQVGFDVALAQIEAFGTYAPQQEKPPEWQPNSTTTLPNTRDPETFLKKKNQPPVNT